MRPIFSPAIEDGKIVIIQHVRFSDRIDNSFADEGESYFSAGFRDDEDAMQAYEVSFLTSEV